MTHGRPDGADAVSFRDARSADLAAIVAIYNQAIAEQATGDTEPVSVEGRRAWLDDHARVGRPILVAEAGEEVLGWASLSAYRPGRAALRHTAEISYYTHVSHRRRGISAALIQSAIARCPAQGIHTLFAIVLDDNRPSIGLLEKLGFERWGHMPRVASFGDREVGHFYYGRRLG
jgi:phosphinothricin acetyltransferase